MYTKNLTVMELYASFAQATTIAEFFEQGTRLENDRLTVSALEELIRRGELDLIVDELDWAFDRANMANQSGAVSLIASTLRDSCRELDPLLCHYGKYLLDGHYIGPTDWLRLHAKQYRKTPRSGVVRNARPWAKEIIFLEEFISPFDAEPTKGSFCSWATESIVGQALPGNDR